MDMVATFSRKSKNTVTKSARKQKKCTVPRNMTALQSTETFNAPVFYPTIVTENSDYKIMVTNPAGVRQGVILVHRKHLCNNLQYFRAIFANDSNFRESSEKESKLVTPYAPKLVNSYFKALYEHTFFLTTENCLAFYHTADYYNDQDMLPSCIAFIKDNMTEDLVFELLQQTSAFDSTCVQYVKSNGIADIDKHRAKIGKISPLEFQYFFKQIAGSLTPINKLSLLSYWIEDNKDCIQVVTDTDYHDISAHDRYNFCLFLQNKLDDYAFIWAYKHIIGATNLRADRFLENMGQNKLILSDIMDLNNIDYTDIKAVMRWFVQMKTIFRIGRQIDDYRLVWDEHLLKWVPSQELNSEDGDFILDQRDENYVIRHAKNKDFALTAPFLGLTDNTTVKLSQWLGNDNQKLRINPDLQGDDDGLLRLTFLQDPTKFIAGKFQPTLFNSLTESDPMIYAQSWLKFTR